jgi:hypothetical protein
MPLKPCLGVDGVPCGALSHGSRCPTHTAAMARAGYRAQDARRGNSAQRGYGPAHRARRAALLPYAIGTPCPRCGAPMLQGQALDLGHSTALAHNPYALGDRIEHAHCNRQAGARTRKA